MRYSVHLLAVALVFSACVSAPKKVTTADPDKIRILTLNVENLFDTEDDPVKNDETFQPLKRKSDAALINRCRTQADSKYRQDECLDTDWSKAILDRKFKRLTHLLAQMNNGAGPDILILQEIENRHVLELWRDGYLQNMGYITISHVEGPDERGIDNAVMSRLPLVGEPQLHLMDYSKTPELTGHPQRATRGILETRLRLPTGETAAVFAVHFPSQGAPTIHRRAALETLFSAIDKLPAGMPVIAGGDFNITAKEDWKEKYYRELVSPRLTVSHLVGCQGCAGTMYYNPDKTWSFFDVLLFSKDLDTPTGNWSLDRSSIQIVNRSVYQTNRWGSPAKFKSGKGAVGVTDHWPMYAELVHKPAHQAGTSK